MSDLRQTKEFALFLKLCGWLVEKVGQDYVYIRKMPLTPFSIIKIQRPEKIDFKKIDQLAKKYRALATYFEPSLSPITYHLSPISNGFRLSHSPFLPTRTIQLDLNRPENEILSQMKKDGRYGIRKAEKEAIQPIKVTDLASFRQVWKKANGWQKYVPSLKSLISLKKSFGKKAIFLTAKNKSALLAGTVILIADQTAYYYYAFTSKEGRQKFAQYLLVWEAIRIAKKLGCSTFDFEGIYDKRFPIKSWQGFSHFKKSFGGKEVEYPGCFRKTIYF